MTRDTASPAACEAGIGGEHGAVAGRPRHQAQRDLERDAEQALRSHEQPAEVRARLLEAVAPERCDGPVAEHDAHPEHVVRRHPVPEAMRAAGVERHVAADRADRLARGVRRVVQPVRRGECRDREVHDAGFDDGESRAGIEPQHAVHAVQRDDDAVFDRARRRPRGSSRCRGP